MTLHQRAPGPPPLRLGLWARLALALLLFLQASGARAHEPEAPIPKAPRRVIVRLTAPSLAAHLAAGEQRPSLTAAQATRYLELLSDAQAAQEAALLRALPGAAVEARYRVTFNGFAVRLPATDPGAVDALRALSGVSAVYEETAYEPCLYAGISEVGAPTLWQSLGGLDKAGAGVKIAVIDGGIDVDHPMFASDGLRYPSGYPKGDGRYTTPKVIAARAYFRPGDPPLPGEDAPVPGLRGSGHGTHVAGIAAGRTGVATYRGLDMSISGVAPQSWLLNYRVFYPTAEGAPEVAYSTEVLQAIEDAVTDDANILCLAWADASPRLSLASPVAEAIGAAIKAGRVVVAPAGGAGPGPGSVTAIAGGQAQVLTVGAVTKDRVLAHDLADVAGPSPVPPQLVGAPFARALFGPTIQARVGPAKYQDVSRVATGSSPYACASLPAGSLSGAIALVRRGECNFADKAYHAQQAGAVAAVIYSDDDAPTEMGCAGDYCAPGTITIPTVMVGKTFALAALQWLTAYPEATLALDPAGRIVSERSRVVASFSGRGPGFGSAVKPDVVAPGVRVLSASVPSEPTHLPAYAQLNGTSAACAHVAGGAALLLQANPSWGPAEVLGALVGTASTNPVLKREETGQTATVLDRGGGLVDLARAASTTLIATPPSLALTGARPGTSRVVRAALRDLRATGPVLRFAVTIARDPGITLTGPAEVALRPGETVTVELGLSVGAGTPPDDYEADVRLTSGNQWLHIPLWVQVRASTQAADVLLIDSDASHFGEHRDYAPYLKTALTALGYSYHYWNADERFGGHQTIPDLAELERYPTVIWLTGDNARPDGYYLVSTPLTAVDMQLLASYLDGGGRLLATGQNLAEASDVNPDDDATWGRSRLYHEYLGAHWVQGSLFGPGDAAGMPPQGGPALIGVPDSFLAGVSLHLGPVGDGAGNQNSVDEVAPGGAPDGSDARLVQPLLVAVGGYPEGSGYAAVAKSGDPTLEHPQSVIPYRSVYYAFGFEGLNDGFGTTPRAALLKRTLDWLHDRVVVATRPERIASLRTMVPLTCTASSTLSQGIVGYRWRLGEGDGARIVRTTEPTLTLPYETHGDHPYAVEARDALGHTAVASGTVAVRRTGASHITASASSVPQGGRLTYTVLLANTEGTVVPLTCTLTLPPGTEYVSHIGGAYSGGVFAFSERVEPGGAVGASVTVRVASGLPARTELAATAQFASDIDGHTQVVKATVLAALRIPLVVKGGR